MNLQFSPSSPNERFVNLRHAQNGLVAVGSLASVEVDAGSKIFLSIGDLDILYSSGALVAANHLSGTVEQFDVADTEPRCAIELIPGSFTLFFEDRHVSYSIDDNIVEKCDSPVIPAFSVIASPLSTVSSRIPAVSLSRKYSASETRLDPTDIERVSSAFLASVANATTSAWTRSRFVSPVVTRCRVVDENGQTVFVGPPQLINPLTDVDILPVAVWSVGTDFNSLPTNSVDIDSFGLQFKTIVGTASPRLSVIVEVINRMSLIDFDNLATCLLSRNSSGNTSLTVTSPALTAIGETWRAVAAMLSSADELFVPFARIENPFDGTEKTILLQPDKPFITASSPAEVSRQLKRRLELSDFHDCQAVESLGLPHRFTPSVASKNGSAILYANPEVIFFDGYAPPCFVSSRSGKTGRWRATATVEFDNGKSVGVASVESSGDLPLIMSPVISYPSRRAKAIEIEVSLIGGATWRRHFELSPLSGRDMAIFINESLRPVDLSLFPASESVIKESNPPRLSMPGAIVTASADSPFLPVDMINDGDAEIVTIAPVVCSPRGLEQRHNRFYLFGNEGIKLVTLSDSRQVINIVLTDRRGVNSANCVAIDGNGRVVSLTVSRHLLALSGASTTTLDRVDGRAIVADNIHDELWILTDSPDEVTVRDMTAGDYYRRLIDGRVDDLLNMPTSSSILIGNKLSRPGCELSTGMVKIEATVKVDGTSKSRHSSMHPPAMFLFKLGATHADAGLVTAAPDDLLANPRGGAVRSKIFSGVISREITLPVNFYPSETYTAHIEASVTPGSVYGGVKIMYRR